MNGVMLMEIRPSWCCYPWSDLDEEESVVAIEVAGPSPELVVSSMIDKGTGNAGVVIGVRDEDTHSGGALKVLDHRQSMA